MMISVWTNLTAISTLIGARTTEQSQVKHELSFCARVLLGNIRRIFLLKNLGYWNAYRYAPLYPLSVRQISRESDNAFALYSSSCKCAKRGRKIRRKKTKKLSQFLKSHISGIPQAISLKFEMWSTEVGGNVHSKICLVSSRHHRATEVRILRFLSSCQYTHGVARRLLGSHDTLPCVLICDRIWEKVSFFTHKF